MATLSVTQITTAGVTEPALVPASAGGDQFSDNGRTFMRVTNGGASPITVTVTAQRTCDQGQSHNITNTVAAGATEVMGPFTDRSRDAAGFVQVTYSAVTSVTVGCFSV
jgi:hypothetical protein